MSLVSTIFDRRLNTGSDGGDIGKFHPSVGASMEEVIQQIGNFLERNVVDLHSESSILCPNCGDCHIIRFSECPECKFQEFNDGSLPFGLDKSDKLSPATEDWVNRMLDNQARVKPYFISKVEYSKGKKKALEIVVSNSNWLIKSLDFELEDGNKYSFEFNYTLDNNTISDFKIISKKIFTESGKKPHFFVNIVDYIDLKLFVKDFLNFYHDSINN